MKLIEPTEEYCRQIRAYRQEFLDCGDSMDGTAGLRRMEDPEKWVEHCRLLQNPVNVPEGRVPATQYIFVREEDNKIVGMLQIRHYLNDYLEKYGGHIGYSVAPSERRKGYASLMLKCALPECKKLGMEKVLITCMDNNIGSRKTILANGGVYESTVYEPDEKISLERYRIDLEAGKMAPSQEMQAFVHRLIGKRLVQFGCEADILEFVFSENLVLHGMGLSRVICDDDLLVTTFDYQSWDGQDSAHNDEWKNAERIKDRIRGGIVTAAALSKVHDLRIELDNGFRIECLISRSHPHYAEESEQWVLFEHTADHSGRFLTVSNKSILFT